MSDTKRETFVCPGCGERIDVSPEIRTAIEQRGCPLCATPVEHSAFRKFVDSSESK